MGSPPTSSLVAKLQIKKQTSPVEFGHQERKQGGDEGERQGPLPLTPGHLLSCESTQLSPHSGPRQLRRLLPLILFKTGRQMHQTPRATRLRGPPFAAFKEDDEYEKALHRGL